MMYGYIGLIIVFLLSRGVFAQPLKRIQYDETLYGVSVPNLRSFKEVASYYGMPVKALLSFNQRFESDFDTTNLYYGQPIKMPAGCLLRVANPAFDHFAAYYSAKAAKPFEEGIFFMLDTLESQGTPIADSLALGLIDVDGLFAADSVPWAFALDRYDLPARHTAYTVLKKHSETDQYIELLLFFYADLVGRVTVATYRKDEDGRAWKHALVTDYNGDDVPDIMIESDTRNPESWPYRSAFFTYELYLFENGTLEAEHLKAPFELLWQIFHGKKQAED